jgi:hypothetical protein
MINIQMNIYLKSNFNNRTNINKDMVTNVLFTA